MKTTLVVYYSRTGTTRMVAESLATLLEADIEEIRETATRRGMMGFLGGCKDSMLDKPAELTSSHSTEGRSVIVLGMPVWAACPPPAVRAYLGMVDLAGKTVCGFCTHRGGGAAKMLARLADILPEGLAERLDLDRPKADDPQFQQSLADWAGHICALNVSE